MKYFISTESFRLSENFDFWRKVFDENYDFLWKFRFLISASWKFWVVVNVSTCDENFHFRRNFQFFMKIEIFSARSWFFFNQNFHFSVKKLCDWHRATCFKNLLDFCDHNNSIFLWKSRIWSTRVDSMLTKFLWWERSMSQLLNAVSDALQTCVVVKVLYFGNLTRMNTYKQKYVLLQNNDFHDFTNFGRVDLMYSCQIWLWKLGTGYVKCFSPKYYR